MHVRSAPGRVPGLGHLPAYIRDPLKFLTRAQGVGPFVEIDFPMFKSVMLTEPEHIEEVLVGKAKSFSKDVFAQDLKRLLGEGLLTSEGDFWLRQRRLAQPAFHKERIASYGRTMVECAEAEVNRWRDGEV